MPQYLLTISRRPQQNGKPTARIERFDNDAPFKRGPLSASISSDDTLMMQYGCADMADVRGCLANEGRRCDFVSWVVGLLDNVTFAEDVDPE